MKRCWVREWVWMCLTVISSVIHGSSRLVDILVTLETLNKGRDSPNTLVRKLPNGIICSMYISVASSKVKPSNDFPTWMLYNKNQPCDVLNPYIHS